MKKEIEKYKGVSLKYNIDDGLIYFDFEGTERKTKYVFEARQIIDEPVWEDCDLDGYFIDGYIDKYIGKAKAVRKDIKTGEPDWRYKGQYDANYNNDYKYEKKKVYMKSSHNDEVYKQWKEQRDIYLTELNKLNSKTNKLI